MAGLCGVNVERTVALVFCVGAAYAAIAGMVVLLRYGGASFYDGFLLGFKALTAAIIGGIGSVRGAFVGAVLVGVVDTAGRAFLPGLLGAFLNTAAAAQLPHVLRRRTDAQRQWNLPAVEERRLIPIPAGQCRGVRRRLEPRHFQRAEIGARETDHRCQRRRAVEIGWHGTLLHGEVARFRLQIRGGQTASFSITAVSGAGIELYDLRTVKSAAGERAYLVARAGGAEPVEAARDATRAVASFLDASN